MQIDQARRRAARVLILLVLGQAALARVTWAAAPVREFLEGLRQRGYHELALAYLDQAQASKLVKVETKALLDYERGLTLVDSARSQRDLGLRERQLDQAQTAFEKFAQAQSGHPLLLSARGQMANIVVERARIRMGQAERTTTETEKKDLQQKALALFDEAEKVFSDNAATIATKLKSMPTGQLDPRKDADLIAERDQLRADYVQAQLVSATILYEKAEILKADPKAYKETLTKAAEKYREVGDKYRKMIAGFYAVLFEGRCYKDMGDMKQALASFETLLELPDQPPALWSVKTKALRLAMECWLHPSQNMADKAIEVGAGLVDKARGSAGREPDLLAVRLVLARAYKAKADATKDSPEKTRQWIGEATKHAQEVARYKSDDQKAATELLAQLGAGAAEQAEDKPEPKNFADARQAGIDALNAMKTATTLMAILEPKVKTAKDAAARAELQGKVDEARQRSRAAQEDAARYMRHALRLSDRETSVDELNDVRYYLAYLSFLDEDFLAASVLGEFLAVRYPSNSNSRSSAKIAMAAYLKMYNEHPDKAEFELRKVAEIAEFISRNWPDQKEGEEALTTLVSLMVRAGNLEQAQTYLQKIPADSPRRGEAELRTGQALWSNYLQGMQQLRETPEGTQPAVDPAELEKMKESAQVTLAAGIERMKTAPLNATLLRAVLSLAQIYVDTDQAAKALQLLVDPQIGAKTLVDANHELTRVEGFAEETFKATLRAYIGSLAGSQDANATIDKAVAVMDQLKKTVGDTEAQRNKLIAIYVSLARDLEKQMEISTPEVKQALSQGFEMFLNRAGQAATEFNVLNWVAETFYSLGKGFDDPQGNPPPDAVKYYGEALKMYEKILANASQLGLDANLVLQVQMRTAMTKRRIGQFDAAIEMFVKILGERERMLNVQVEAAKTYQEWAGSEKPDHYLLAIRGAHPNPKTQKNIIWGWGRLAQTTAPYPDHRETFHEARYSLANCRYAHALTKSGAEKDKLLEMAKQDITMTYRLYPELGSPQWRTRYDALLKKIQQGLGETPAGLDGLQTADSPKAS